MTWRKPLRSTSKAGGASLHERRVRELAQDVTQEADQLVRKLDMSRRDAIRAITSNKGWMDNWYEEFERRQPQLME